MRVRNAVAAAVALVLSIAGTPITTLSPARAAEPPVAWGDSEAAGPTPPRLSYVDGEVSFWRPGAAEWAAAQVNTALAPGDELYTGSPGNLEMQIDSRGFVRAWGGTAIGILNHEPDILQLKLTSGHLSVDLRSLEPGRVVELDTPGAAFIIDRAGYYRADVGEDRTSFTVRRGGSATVTAPTGQSAAIASGHGVIIEGSGAPQLRTYAAGELDVFDRWSYARTDYLVESPSARYATPSMYGLSDLDRHGTWRATPSYGSVWVPSAVPAGWVPYSTGSWMWDPYYGWTWVDTAPWGWAPYHYGRWVFVDSVWAWAPGPVLVRPVYAPALVAFFGGGPSVRVSVGGPVVGWVALGWGEPVVPWWGPVAFVGRPWWGGWGGPRVVNNVVVNRHTVVNVQNITVYRNATVQNALVAVHQERFGRGPIGATRVKDVDRRNFEPIRGPLHVRPEPASFTPTTARGVRPPDERRVREVVATRAPRQWSGTHSEETKRAPGSAEAPPPRIVPAPRDVSAPAASRSGRDQKRSDAPQLTAPRPDGGRLDAPATPRGEPRASSNRESSRAPEPSIVPPARSPGVQGQQAGPGSERRSRGPEMGAPTSPQGPSPVAPAPGDQGKREPRAFGAPPSAPPVTPRSQPGVERPAPRPESNPSSAAAPSQPSREPRMQLPTPTPQPPAGVEGQPRRSERPSSRPEMTAPQPPRPQMTVPPRTPAQPGPERPPQRPEMGAPQPAPPSGPQPRSEPPARRPEVSRPPAPPPAQPTREPRGQTPPPARVESQPQRQEREPGKSSLAEPSRRGGENDRRGKG